MQNISVVRFFILRLLLYSPSKQRRINEWKYKHINITNNCTFIVMMVCWWWLKSDYNMIKNTEIKDQLSLRSLREISTNRLIVITNGFYNSRN